VDGTFSEISVDKNIDAWKRDWRSSIVEEEKDKNNAFDKSIRM
jgi:hypothetical protein